jgi:DNA-binding NarL/FixJ family response regulator
VTSNIRVSVYLQNRLLRDSIARILSKRADFDVIAAQPCQTTATSAVLQDDADVVLLDSLELLMESAKPLNGGIARASGPRKILLAMEDDPSQFLRAVRSGVSGYVLQDASAADVVNAIRSVSEGQAICPPRYTQVLFEYIAEHTQEMPSGRRRAHWGLTRREQQLIPLIERGLSNKEIAGYLHLSEQTVKNHVHRILRKTGVSDRLSVGEVCRESSSDAGARSGAGTSSGTDSKQETARVPS